MHMQKRQKYLTTIPFRDLKKNAALENIIF